MPNWKNSFVLFLFSQIVECKIRSEIMKKKWRKIKNDRSILLQATVSLPPLHLSLSHTHTHPFPLLPKRAGGELMSGRDPTIVVSRVRPPSKDTPIFSFQNLSSHSTITLSLPPSSLSHTPFPWRFKSFRDIFKRWRHIHQLKFHNLPSLLRDRSSGYPWITVWDNKINCLSQDNSLAQ